MNREHLWVFLWLRWRLRVNQIKRTGTLNAILTAIFGVALLIASVWLFAIGIAVGAFAMPQFSFAVRMYVWDGIVLVFLFVWTIGLLSELQRSEGLAINKVLHLPVSPSGAFLVNYLSSLLSVTLILFVPGMIGLILGQIYWVGSIMLLAFPLLAAFIFALTALTYQFQGWLASMMSNPRRRRTVIVLVTAGIVLLVQIPNLLNMLRLWDTQPNQPPVKTTERHVELQRKFNEGQITGEELERKRQTAEEEAVEAAIEQQKAKWLLIERTTRFVNSLIPPGWFALGTAELADGHVYMALVGMLGLGLIGVWSLRRAYRTTIRMYSEGGSGDGRRPSSIDSTGELTVRPKMVEWTLPWISEYAASVATAGFRSFLRAPESKVLLIVPFMVVIAFSGVFLSKAQMPPKVVGPFLPPAIMGMMMMAMMQLAGNQFGFDRAGFRAFVLSPVPRREILLGKNLALAPLVLGLGLIAIIAVGLTFKLGLSQFATAVIQILTMFLLYCMMTNICSIYAPIAIPSGTLKATRPGMTVLVILLGCMMVSPVVLGLPAILPLMVELILADIYGITSVPVSLVLSLVILVVVAFCYRHILIWEGRLLAARERRILEVVTAATE